MVSSQIIGKVIKSARIRAGMTQEVLSGLAGVDRTHYSKIERGLRTPTIETLFKIADALDMKPHILVKGIEEALHESNGHDSLSSSSW